MKAEKKNGKGQVVCSFKTSLKKGDPVMLLSGGNSKKGRALSGQTGKILRFLPKSNRVVVEGLNIVKRHKRATSMSDKGGIIQKEAGVHISNVMYYSDELKRPVRIKFKLLQDGRKVRGYLNPKTNAFEQIDA